MTDETFTDLARERTSGPLAIDTLDADWRRLLSSPLLAGRFRVWRQAEPVLATFSGPAPLVCFLHDPAGEMDRKDIVLLALLRHAKREPLAARVVLQALRPALKGLAARLLTCGVEREELWSLLMEIAWQKIRAYPVARRPSRVAANLRLDTLHDVQQQLHLERAARALLPARPLGSGSPSPSPVCDGNIEAPLARAVAARAITADEAELIARTRIDGVGLSELAVPLRVKRDTLKHRRARAERRLAIFLGARVPSEGPDRRSHVALGFGGGPPWGASSADQATGTKEVNDPGSPAAARPERSNR